MLKRLAITSVAFLLVGTQLPVTSDACPMHIRVDPTTRALQNAEYSIRSNDYKGMLYTGGLTRLQIDRTNQKGMGDFRKPVLTQDTMYCRDNGIAAFNISESEVVERAKEKVLAYRKSDKYPDKFRAKFPERWRLTPSPRTGPGVVRGSE